MIPTHADLLRPVPPGADREFWMHHTAYWANRACDACALPMEGSWRRYCRGCRPRGLSAAQARVLPPRRLWLSDLTMFQPAVVLRDRLRGLLPIRGPRNFAGATA